MTNQGKKLENNLRTEKYFLHKGYFPIFLIIITSFVVRIIYFPFDIPLTLDNLEYFLYAYDSSIQGKLPNDYSPANNGWPAFMAIFFSIFKFEDPISYMNLQRMISIIISTVTTIPIFFLCRKFFNKSFSLIGASIFAFEPRLIQNSLLGVTEPLFILLTASTLALFLSNNKKIIYASFATSALASIVRSEGIILFFIISIMFFVKYRKSIKVIPKYIPALLIFVLILLPMISYKQEIHGDDRIFGRVGEAISDEKNIGFFEEGRNEEKVVTGITNFSKFFLWNLIPIFIIFVPTGIFLIFNKLNFRKITIIISILGMSIPAFYAYSLSSLDTRYLFVLYPMLSIISIFTIKKIYQKRQIKKKEVFLFILVIFIASNVFLDYKKTDYEHEKNIFLLNQHIVEIAEGVNLFSPESRYLKTSEVIKNWPNIPEHTLAGHFEEEIHKIPTDDFTNLERFILSSNDQGITHLVIDNNQNRPEFLKKLLEDEKMSYLIKEYEFQDEYYHVKVFQIDFEKMK